RLLKGEELGAVSREIQVPVHELERWRRLFLEGAMNGFKRRDTPAAEREHSQERFSSPRGMRWARGERRVNREPRAAQEIRLGRAAAARCQSASKFDPRSASKGDPLVGE